MTSRPTLSKAKAYSRIKLTTGVLSSVVAFLILVLLVLSGLSQTLAQLIHTVSGNPYVAVLIFVLAVGLLQTIFTLPLGFYSGYVTEHRYGLSNQSIGRWLWERGKGLLVSLPIGIVLVLLLYYALRTFGDLWWLPISAALALLSVVMARLAPTLILPLFYKLRPLEEGDIREQIMALCRRAGLSIRGIFLFNLSKNTKKANAGFTGIGKSRRVILGDTLMEMFTPDEIETVFAHELGHYVHRHIIIGIITGVVLTIAGLFVTSRLYAWSVEVLEFRSIDDLAALPLLGIWLSLYGLVTTPLGNLLSRRHERQADVYAVKMTSNKQAFISALNRLEQMNLADPEPHRLVEFLFYSHPSINKRVSQVEAL